MFDEARLLMDKVQTLDPTQKSTFVTWLVITLIRDISYYAVIGIVVFALGRRMIQAFLSGLRESRRQNA